MEGIRTTILPPNLEAFDQYFMDVWYIVHPITAAVSSQFSELDCPEKFKLYLDLEEARLEKNLRAADYVIDGIDTLTQITGHGRIEKVRNIKRCGLHYFGLTQYRIADRISTVIRGNEAPL
jgi:hypothetical protein